MASAVGDATPENRCKAAIPKVGLDGPHWVRVPPLARLLSDRRRPLARMCFHGCFHAPGVGRWSLPAALQDAKPALDGRIARGIALHVRTMGDPCWLPISSGRITMHHAALR